MDWLRAVHTFVIAEVGVNHNGNVQTALDCVARAAEAGATAVKFQTFTADTLVAQNTPAVAYQRDGFGADDQHAMLRELELSLEAHGRIAEHCAAFGVEFMSTAFDAASLDMLLACGIQRIKIPSGEITNAPFLEDCAGRGLPVILSTGMADLAEVGEAVGIVRSSMHSMPKSDQKLPALTVLHCTSSYPAAPEDVNLRAMRTIAGNLAVAVGYSDHTEGIAVAPLAVAMGAVLIEKHFTLDRSMRGPDHQASLEPALFAEMVESIRHAELVLGSADKVPCSSEMEARHLVRRGLKAARNIEAGSILEGRDIAVLRPASGLPPAMLAHAVGRRTHRRLPAGSPIENSDLV